MFPDDEMVKGTDIDSFVEWLSTFEGLGFFHNLKFDGHFLIDWLLNNGFDYIHDPENRTIPKGCFTAIISATNKFYSITIRWANGNTTELRDSAKKLPMSVARVAKAFKLPMSKGDIDYHKPRPVGYEPTAEEWDYLERDVRIIAYALKEVIESGMTRLTVASDSLAEYKRLMDKRFDRLFPILSDEQDAEIRRAYRGGFTIRDERYRGKITSRGLVFDVNSLYPSVMYNSIIPYGEPVYQSGKVSVDERYPCAIFSVTFTAKIKPNHIPCIQIKGSSIFGATEYLSEIKEPVTLMVTNVDWALWQDHYDIDILAYGGGWKFFGTQGMFNSYIDKWMAVKVNSEGGQREIAKLHLNSLYGKFATNPNVTGKMPVLKDGVVKFVMGPEATKPPVYTAAGVFITSYARDLTIRAAQANYSTFAYADTDSLHLIDDGSWTGTYTDPDGVTHVVPENLDIHPSRMGAWKLEYGFERAAFVRAKAYLEEKADGSYKVAWAGLPQGVAENMTFDSLVDGAVVWGKLVPRSVPGGVVLEDTPYTITL